MADLSRSSEILVTELEASAERDERRVMAELYRDHAAAAYGLLTRLVGPHPDRDALPTFRGESTMATFVCSIAVRVAYDHLRRQSREGRGRRDVLAQALTHVNTSERASIGREVEEAAAALARLKPPHRIAFVLREVMSYSYPEIAELCACRATTARMRVSAARRALRRMLGGRRRA